MRYLFASVGSTGDILPFVAIGAHLRARGHEVALLAGFEYGEVARQNGLEFVSLATSGDYLRGVHDKRILTTQYSALFVDRHVVPWNAVAYRTIRRLAGRDLVVLAVDRPNFRADLFAYAHFQANSIRVQIDLPILSGNSGLSRFGLPQTRVQQLLAARWQRQ
jgi:hypothetical protein